MLGQHLSPVESRRKEAFDGGGVSFDALNAGRGLSARMARGAVYTGRLVGWLTTR